MAMVITANNISMEMAEAPDRPSPCGRSDGPDEERPSASASAPRGEPPPDLRSPAAGELIYSLEDTPAWHTTQLLGIQHFMTTLASIISAALLLAPALCVSYDVVAVGEILGTVFFVNGLVTLLQTTFGVRLPIVQGPSLAFLVPTYSILNERGDCPAAPTANSTSEELVEAEEEWKSRMREIQGAIIVASCLQVAVGAAGIVGILLRYIGPLTVAPTIALIGIGLFKTAAVKAGLHWGIAVVAMVSIIIFSQFLSEVRVPCLGFSKAKKCHVTWIRLFKLFPIILGIGITWLLCFLLTTTGVIPDDPSAYGYGARTDLNQQVLRTSVWFYLPYPGQWGVPQVTPSGVLGITAGVLASIVESIGDYHACARLSGAPPPPPHAVNRGLLVEGVGCIMSGAWGSGTGTTSHSENIGAIALTKVGSRRVVQAAGITMILVGQLGKLGGLFATIPDPIGGALICITFGMVTAVGFSNLQFINLNSTRNLSVLGFSLIMGFVVPEYLGNNQGAIKTGVATLDQAFTVILSTGMFVGGFLAFLLDNTIPGSDEERGLTQWRHKDEVGKAQGGDQEGDVEENRSSTSTEADKGSCRAGSVVDEGTVGATGAGTSPPKASGGQTSLRCYELPIGMDALRRWSCCRYLPFSPTFEGFRSR